MAFVKKDWKDRIAEFINRRRLTYEDGRTELVEVARDEGNISQEGDAFNAENMNDLEERVAEEFKKVVEKTDIIDNLESTETEKPLSAKQGKILKENFEDYLPLSGGTLKGAVNNLWAGEQGAIGLSGIAMNFNGENESYLCFDPNTRRFSWYDTPNDYTRYDFLDTRNKPFGSYIGNGSYDRRFISTGGIGNAIIIYREGTNSFTLLTPKGGIFKNDTTVEGINTAWYANGEIEMVTGLEMVNASGVTYHYQII